MGLHHRHKQRVLTTLATLLILTLSIDVFFLSYRALGTDIALLLAFTAAICLTTAYQCYNYRHSHERLTLVNTLTQAFLGCVLLAGCVLSLAFHALSRSGIVDTLLALCVFTLSLTFLFLRKFDEYLESEVQSRFPIGAAPSPSRPKGARKER